jgi:acyl carrier protein
MDDLKRQIVEALKLEEVKAQDVQDDAPLFGQGLGLDSIDALELVVMIEKQYGILIKDMEVGRKAFASVRSLAQFVQDNRKKCAGGL